MEFKSDTSIQEENTDKIKTHNAEWLKELEVQSWQAVSVRATPSCPI